LDGDKENCIRIAISTNDGINIFQGMLKKKQRRSLKFCLNQIVANVGLIADYP